MSKPLISIIFPTFNRKDEVEFNLNFFKENISVPYEVFILDNSPEPSDFSLNHNEYYIFLNENIGTSSRNIGITKANSPICLLLDDDSHPFPGTVEKIIEEFKKLPENCAGLISEIHNPDGGREASLLPTVFHGAGVAFKTDVLINNGISYPENFCFYGEEYRMTLELYSHGFHLKKSDSFKVMHRRSQQGRDLSKIFYFLGRNNKAIWEDLVPGKFLSSVQYDSQRRYELTSIKENVSDAFQKGIEESLSSSTAHKMSVDQFEQFSMLSMLNEIPFEDSYVLCGTGKFPTLWAEQISMKCKKLIIADFNSGLIDHTFGDFKVVNPESAVKENAVFINGLSSDIDFEKWHQLLTQNNREELVIRHGYKPNFC